VESAVSDAQMPAPDLPTWRIERFELIYCNPRHRRWQYFIEDPVDTAIAGGDSSPTTAVHRRQIPRLLNTLRRVITDAAASEASIDIPALDRSTNVVLEQPAFDGWSERKNAYLDYLLHTANSEGLDLEVMKGLKTLVGELKLGGSQLSIKPRVAHALLSLLPIKEEWDTWGCFTRARQGNSTSGLPPTQPGTSWFQPFYLAEFTYKKSSLNANAISVRLLGEEVTLEAGCRDLSRPSEIAFVEPRDFYEYCHRPDAGATSADDELFLYRCYGHFVDALIKALLTPPSANRGSETRRIFLIAYPVQVAGRLHFVQIALTTADTTVTVKSLSETWARIHRTFWVPEYVSVLESTLERISLSAFQLAIDEHLRDYSIEQLRSYDPLKTALASAIFHVLPLRSLRVGSDQWRYAKYDGRTLPSPINAVLGRRWECSSGTLKSYATDVDFAIPSQNISGRLAAFGDHRLHGTVMKDYAVDIIERQIESFTKSMKDRIDEEERDRHLAESILRRHIETLSVDTLNEIADGKREILDSAIDVSALHVGEPFRCPPTFRAGRANLVRRYLTQFHPEFDDVRQFSEYQQMASPRPPELATRLLDSSLVKIATHAVGNVSEYFTGSLDAAKKEIASDGFLGRTAAALTSALRECSDCTGAGALEAAWSEFIEKVTALTELDDLKGAGLKSVNKDADWLITTLRNQLWGPRITVYQDPQWQRVQHIPVTWLDKWFGRYRESAMGHRKALTEAPCICNSETVVAGVLPKPNTGTTTVNLKDRGLWLPYVVENSSMFESGSHLLNTWFESNCDRWAQLGLVYPSGNTGQRVVIARRSGGVNSWQALDDRSPLRSVFRAPVKAKPDNADKEASRETPCAHPNESLVVVVRTWVASS
jgi:hypothetical protein